MTLRTHCVAWSCTHGPPYAAVRVCVCAQGMAVTEQLASTDADTFAEVPSSTMLPVRPLSWAERSLYGHGSRMSAGVSVGAARMLFGIQRLARSGLHTPPPTGRHGDPEIIVILWILFLRPAAALPKRALGCWTRWAGMRLPGPAPPFAA